MDTTIITPIDCACVIHGDAYPWVYVERLFAMLKKHLSYDIRLHVYTEKDRPVPATMIKHELEDFGIAGPRRAWWYKMQLFNVEHHAGPLLYFDLDTVIVDNIDWICQQPLNYFWAVRDFKYLWRESDYKVNSSIMWWNTQKFDGVWQAFKRQDLKKILIKYHGDQDYINDAIGSADRRFFDTVRVKSWRWQCLDGGFNFRRKCYQNPGTGTAIDQRTSVLIFHGNPKPGELQDSVVNEFWNV
jgi:hypothetical protein